MKENLITVYRVAPCGFNPLIMSELQDVLYEVKQLLECSEVGDDVNIEIAEMKEEVYRNLPEHTGW